MAPAFFLHYTSISPKHKHSFLTMDLLFERFLTLDSTFSFIATPMLFVDGSPFTAPLGACSSLAKVFKMLAPLEMKMDHLELDLLRGVGEIVVALRWLSVPAHFDSPLVQLRPSGLMSISSCRKGTHLPMEYSFCLNAVPLHQALVVEKKLKLRNQDIQNML
ncbi:hypothetical protein BLNAU_11367 [Blattamonas nauphoetae]|uniref:Uncharacterized protein n=1 Tax=Blattamonas nauphoetae TaxID=2049346 RepID=A0ABQ9XMM1_9EUKA|nr:hypothetical protein BLNAU_11367 [Blattamonas nauphoetae]